MLKEFKAVCFSFERVPLKLRESLALDEVAVKKLLSFFKEFSSLKEVLILSTCNRTEIFYSSDRDQSTEIVKLVGIENGITNPTRLLDHCAKLTDHDEAVRRLFEVSIGLHSQVKGDLQITHQVKKAYQWSVEEDLAGPFLHRLMHTIFHTNKRVVQETAFRDGAASVSYATLEQVEEFVAQVETPKILIIGLGKIGEDICGNFSQSRFKNNVFIANRTLSKAQDLARRHGAKVIEYDKIPEFLPEADVVISSLSVKKPFITKSQAEKIKILTYKYFVDLSVPRSIDPEIEEIPGILVYNIDDIKSKTSKSLKKRLAATPQVNEIISQSILDFDGWSKEMEISPALSNFKEALEKIRKAEIARNLKHLSKLEIDTLEKITKGIIERIVRRPASSLRSACKRDEADTLIEGLVDLFDLDKTPNPSERKSKNS